MPIVATVATRKRGIDVLVGRDRDAPREPAAGDRRRLARAVAPARSARAAPRGRAASSRPTCAPPKRPDTWTGRLDAVLLHPVGGLAILLALLFLMFQAVFTWAHAGRWT